MDEVTALAEFSGEVLSNTQNASNSVFFLTKFEDMALFLVFMFLAIFGSVANAVTFFVIGTSKDLASSPFNNMIMSLCLSDFLSAVNTPLHYYTIGRSVYDFRLPNFLCKLAHAIEYWSSLSTMQHIIAFVVLRILAIKSPHRIKEISAEKIKVVALLIWIETFLYTIFLMLAMVVRTMKIEEGTVIMCTIDETWAVKAVEFSKYASTVSHGVAILLIIFLSVYAISLIWIRRRKRLQSGIDDVRKENFAVVQLSLIILSFLFGYLPWLASFAVQRKYSSEDFRGKTFVSCRFKPLKLSITNETLDKKNKFRTHNATKLSIRKIDIGYYGMKPIGPHRLR